MTLRDACLTYRLPSLAQCQREHAASHFKCLDLEEDKPP